MDLAWRLCLAALLLCVLLHASASNAKPEHDVSNLVLHEESPEFVRRKRAAVVDKKKDFKKTAIVKKGTSSKDLKKRLEMMLRDTEKDARKHLKELTKGMQEATKRLKKLLSKNKGKEAKKKVMRQLKKVQGMKEAKKKAEKKIEKGVATEAKKRIRKSAGRRGMKFVKKATKGVAMNANLESLKKLVGGR